MSTTKLKKILDKVSQVSYIDGGDDFPSYSGNFNYNIDEIFTSLKNALANKKFNTKYDFNLSFAPQSSDEISSAKFLDKDYQPTGYFKINQAEGKYICKFYGEGTTLYSDQTDSYDFNSKGIFAGSLIIPTTKPLVENTILTMNTTKRLIEQLEKLTNKKVILKEEVKPGLYCKNKWRFKF